MMAVFKEEFRKISRRKLVVVPFLAFLCASIFLSVENRGVATFNTEREEKLYSQEVKNVLGTYSTDIHAAIIKELAEKKDLYEQVRLNPMKEYTLVDLETEINVLNLLCNQLNYVQENPDRRQVIMEAPWDRLIQEIRLQPFPVILIVFISAYIFYMESPNEMYLLIESSINGRRKTNQSKLLLIFLGIITLVLVPEFTKLAVAMPGSWLAPLQSHPFYGYTTLNLNLLQTFLLINLIKIMGLSFISLLSVLLVKLTKNMIVTFIILVVALIAPFYVLKVPLVRVWIPTNLMTPAWLLNFPKPINMILSGNTINSSNTFIVVTAGLTLLLATYVWRSRKVI